MFVPSHNNHPVGAVLPAKAIIDPVGVELTGVELVQAEPLLVRTFPLVPAEVSPVPPEPTARVVDRPPAVIELLIHPRWSR